MPARHVPNVESATAAAASAQVGIRSAGAPAGAGVAGVEASGGVGVFVICAGALMRGSGRTSIVPGVTMRARAGRRLAPARQPFGRARHGGTLPRAVGRTVLPVATRALVDACERLGLDGGALLARAGVDRALLDAPDAGIPAEAADAVWREALAASGDPALALRAAEATPFGAFRVLDFLGATGATLGDGLRRVAAYFSLVDPRAEIAVVEGADAVSLVLRSREGPLPPPAQEYTLAILAGRVRHLAPAPVALAISFTFPRPAHAGEHRRVLGVEPAYGARDAARAVGRGTWESVPRTRDPELFGALDAHARALVGRGAEAGALQARARAAIAAALPGREPTLAAVARAIGTSPRTLQRRLGEEGARFAGIVDAVRRERAEAYLRAGDVSIAEVSWLLGFAEQSAFTRAFRRWTGVAPTGWRLRDAGRR